MHNFTVTYAHTDTYSYLPPVVIIVCACAADFKTFNYFEKDNISTDSCLDNVQ